MAGHGKRRKKGGGHEEEHVDERWLLTYSDMITLLMALFIVMWSMSVVNQGKFDKLAVSLHEAFSGKILPGGQAPLMPGSGEKTEQPAPTPPTPAIVPPRPGSEGKDDGTRSDAAQKEDEDLKHLKEEIDQYAETHGLAREVETQIARRGLVVRVLTDHVLFESGSASLAPPAGSLLDGLARLLKAEVRNPIQVEGNTDNVPVSGRFPTNWELSTARATAVLRALLARGVSANRLSATGYADRNPIASNATDAGRRRNRRVELVVLRMNYGHGGQAGTQGGPGS
jgi:chemotaxis protein MotB